MTTPICIGHSHCEALRLAAEAAGTPLEILNFWHLPGGAAQIGGVWRLAPYVREKLCADPAAPVFSLIGGHVHYDIGLVAHDEPFDFILPEAPDLPLEQGARLIPAGAIEAEQRARLPQFLDMMRDIRDSVTGPVYHLQSPPVSPLDVVPTDDPGFVHFFGAGRRISPVWLREKLYRMHSRLVAEHCAKIGMVFVKRPDEAVDADGFMRPGLQGTPGHASAAYGALQLRQILALCGKPAKAKRFLFF